MENRQQEILSEIKSMMASIRSQLEMLDAKMAEFQQTADSEDFDVEPVDIDIDIDDAPEEAPAEVVTVQEIPLEEPVDEPVAESAEENLQTEDLAAEPVVEPMEEPVAELAAEQPVAEPVAESVSEQPEVSVIEEDLPEDIFGEPEPVPAPAPKAEPSPKQEPVTIAEKAEEKAKPTINEALAGNCAWRRDMPGAPVKDIRSAISLNDRVIFINLLFNEDAQTFVNTLARINTMGTIDQAVEYIMSEFPGWDMNSELVYRFMMAVRRKVK